MNPLRVSSQNSSYEWDLLLRLCNLISNHLCLYFLLIDELNDQMTSSIWPRRKKPLFHAGIWRLKWALKGALIHLREEDYRFRICLRQPPLLLCASVEIKMTSEMSRWTRAPPLIGSRRKTDQERWSQGLIKIYLQLGMLLRHQKTYQSAFYRPVTVEGRSYTNLSEISISLFVYLSRLQREEAKITAWENLQKAKAEAAIRKLEVRISWVAEKKKRNS